MDKERFANYVFDYVKLIGLYLNKKTAEDFKFDDKELSFFVNLSKRHSLLAIFYKALVGTNANVSEDFLKNLEQYYLSAVRKDVLFEKERKDLYEYLNKNEIDYLPLKGLVLRNYYPDPSSREYADNDILFSDKADLIKKFFTNRGYTVESFKKSNHDVYLKKPFFNFEMHRSLFAEGSHNPKFVAYFENCLEESPVKEGHEHILSDEDFYIYFTAHTNKHFDGSGCGIRTLIDYYLFLKNNELDSEYISQELELIELFDFSNKISTLSLKVFDDEELNDEEKEMLLYIASSGTYGTLENNVANGVNERGKFKYFMYRVFPPYSFYKTAYPWAYKTVILIPIAWLARLLRILFKNPRKAANELKLISKAKKEEKADTDQPKE